MPAGISYGNILLTFAKQAWKMGGYKASRLAYNRLQQFIIFSAWKNSVESEILLLQVCNMMLVLLPLNLFSSKSFFIAYDYFFHVDKANA